MGPLESYIKPIVEEAVAKRVREELESYDQRIQAIDVQSGDIMIVPNSVTNEEFEQLLDVLRSMGLMNIALVRADDIRVLRFE